MMNTESLAQEQLAEMSDDQIFQMCRKFGSSALYWRQRFLGLLPEVARRNLYERKGFSSIYVFAFMLAGVSEEQVNRTLNLEERFEDKPILKHLLVNGEVSINKLARIASIATVENQEFLAAQVKLLPQSAIETLVRDEKFKLQNGFLEAQNGTKFVRAHTNLQSSLEVSNNIPEGLNLAEDVQQQLFELQRRGIDLNELLREFLQKREQEIAQEKERISQKIKTQQNQQSQQHSEGPAQKKPSRYISVEITDLLTKEYGTKCAIPNCNKPSREKHHLLRYSLVPNHDPYNLLPLCEDHHAIMHSIDLKYQWIRAAALSPPQPA